MNGPCDPNGNPRLGRVLQFQNGERVVTGWALDQLRRFTLTRTGTGWASDLPQTEADATSDPLVMVCFSGAGVHACVLHRAERTYFRFAEPGAVTDMGHELAQQTLADYEKARREGAHTLSERDVPHGVEDMLNEACKRLVAVRLYKPT